MYVVIEVKDKYVVRQRDSASAIGRAGCDLYRTEKNEIVHENDIFETEAAAEARARQSNACPWRKTLLQDRAKAAFAELIHLRGLLVEQGWRDDDQ